MKNKNAMTQMRAMCLIMNMLVAVVAFTWMIGGVSGADEFYKDFDGREYKTVGSKVFIQDYGPGSEGGWKELPFLSKQDIDNSFFTKFDPSKQVVGTSYTPQPNLGSVDTEKILDITKLKKGQLVDYNGEQVSVIFDKDAAGKTVAGYKNDQEVFTPFEADKVTGVGTGGLVMSSLTDNLVENAAFSLGIGFTISSAAGMFGAAKTTQNALFAAVSVGLMTQKVVAQYLVKSGTKGILPGVLGKNGIGAGMSGIIVGAVLFALMYKKTSTETVEFNCLPYQPPTGGEDCELCHESEGGCSEYKCKSLGQACELVNAGTEEEKCVWVNPNDVNSPKLEMIDVLEDYIYKPDTSVRPPATGVYISQANGGDIKAFTPLEFTIATDEPAQCKIDYNLTTGFEEMSYYVGGTNLFSLNHTETMSLPSPSSINAIAPELENDGTYTLYVRCSDANGNFNQDAYSVRFKVEAGPDTTPPKILDLSVPSNSPISFQQNETYLEVYVNEPAECKWSREDKDYNLMENQMNCNTNLWEMNNQNVYTCATTLTGIQDRAENEYYFRCSDQPGIAGAVRNNNTQSSLYSIIGTQPLTLLEFKPLENEVVKASTSTVPVFLEVKTDNGYSNGEAFCYFTTEEGADGRGDENEFILFSSTESNVHSQRQDLTSGEYTYYIKCVDLGGNTVYDSTTFEVESDNRAPLVVRAYKEAGQLRILTNEEAECSYSNKDCNFNINEGIVMPSNAENTAHATDWNVNKNFYIRCKDDFGNEPSIQEGEAGCSIVVRPYRLETKSDVVVL